MGVVYKAEDMTLHRFPMAALRPSATLRLGGHPDWMVITEHSVWVSNERLKVVHRIDSDTNRVVAMIRLPGRPCCGLTFGFGSLWVPLCGRSSSLARIDAQTNRITTTLPIGPADSEGGITASDDSIWIVTDKKGTLNRIDPAKNTVRQKISVSPGSYNPLFSDGVIWITGFDSNLLTAVDASTGQVLAAVPVGPQPRFVTAGSGSLWTLNQGDGTVIRVDARTKQVAAIISVGIPGPGGEICLVANSVWTTVFDIPLTLIDAKSNAVLRQWIGPGGDSVRFGHDSIWLTNYHRGLLLRIPGNQVLSPLIH